MKQSYTKRVPGYAANVGEGSTRQDALEAVAEAAEEVSVNYAFLQAHFPSMKKLAETLLELHKYDDPDSEAG